MKRVNIQTYCNVTNCTADFRPLYYFTLDEAQDFLNSLGYDIIEHKALGSIQPRESVDGSGEVKDVGDSYVGIVTDILAIKPGTVIPKNLSTPEGSVMRLANVFQRELKAKLLYG